MINVTEEQRKRVLTHLFAEDQTTKFVSENVLKSTSIPTTDNKLEEFIFSISKNTTETKPTTAINDTNQIINKDSNKKLPSCLINFSDASLRKENQITSFFSLLNLLNFMSIFHSL